MSIVERIRQTQAEVARKAADAEAARVAATQKAELEKLAAEELRRRANTEIAARNIKRLEEANIIKQLQQIERDLLAKTHKTHGIFVSTKHNSVTLAWDYKPEQVKSVTVGSDNYTDVVGDDYRSIGVSIKPNDSISIYGSTTTEHEPEAWRKNPELIEKSLAEAFLSPSKHEEHSRDDIGFLH